MNGLIEQWGKCATTDAYTFYVNFSNSEFLICNPLANSTVGTIFGNFGFNLSKSGFSYSSSGATTGMWFAMGY